jgi:ribosome-associated protein
MEAARSKKASNLIMLDMRTVTLVADYFVLMTATSTTHVDTLADAIEASLKVQGTVLWHREGARGAHWVLLDFGDVVVHIFTADERRYYDLERLWGDANVVAIAP